MVVAARSADAASLAGDELLLPGDVIYSINRSPIRSLAELKAAVAGLRQGDPMVLVIERESLLHYVTLEMR